MEIKSNDISNKKARKALKKFGMLSPQLKSLISQTSISPISPISPDFPISPKEKLRDKLRNCREHRLPVCVKEANYEKSKAENTEHIKELTEEQIKNREKERTRRHNKKLNQMATKHGNISYDTLLEAFTRLKIASYKDESIKKHDENIIELYHRQQKFSDNVDFVALDALISSESDTET